MSQYLCQLSDLPEGNGLAVSLEGQPGPRRVVLFRTARGVCAYLDVCPHQGRSFEFAPGEFLLDERGALVCPHHGALFELSGGTCLSGPCEGDRLKPVHVVIEDGAVMLADPG